MLQEAGAAQAAGFRGWVKMEQSWYWLNPDGTVFHGWLDDSGRRYYLGEDGVMAVGWKDMFLQGGEYLLSFGCTGYKDGDFTVFHRLYDACNITVISTQNTVGFYDMNSKVEIYSTR